MGKYIFIFILVLLSQFGITQLVITPSFTTLNIYNPYSLNNSSSNRLSSGIHYSLLNNVSKNELPPLSGQYRKNPAKEQFAEQDIITMNFNTFLQSWSDILISYFEVIHSYQQNNCGIYLITFPKSPAAFQSNSCLLSLYGINQRLSDSEITSSQDMLHYEEPVFKASTLHREKVISDIIKQLRRQEYDFSGLIQEIYHPSTLP